MSLLVFQGNGPTEILLFHPPLQLYLWRAVQALRLLAGAVEGCASLAAMVSACMSILSVVVWLAGSKRLLLRALFVHLRCPARLVHFTGATVRLPSLSLHLPGFARRPILAGVLFALGTFIASTSPRSLSCWRCCSASAPGKSHCACLAATRCQRSHCMVSLAWLATPFGTKSSVTTQQDCASLFLVRQSQKRRLPQYSGRDWGRAGIVWAVAMWALRGRARGETALPGAAGRIAARINLWAATEWRHR